MARPPQIGAELTVNRSTSNISLVRAPQTPSSGSVPAGGFTRARYILHLPPHTAAGEAVMAVPGWSAQRLSFAVGGSVSAPPPAPAGGGAGPATPRWDTCVPPAQHATHEVSRGNELVSKLFAYKPIHQTYASRHKLHPR